MKSASVLALCLLAGCAAPPVSTPTPSQDTAIRPAKRPLVALRTDVGERWVLAAVPSEADYPLFRSQGSISFSVGTDGLSGYDGCNSYSSGYEAEDTDAGLLLRRAGESMSTLVGCFDQTVVTPFDGPIRVQGDVAEMTTAAGTLRFERSRPAALVADDGLGLCAVERPGRVTVPSPPNYSQPVRGDWQFTYPPATARVRGPRGYQTQVGAELLDGAWVEFSRGVGTEAPDVVRLRRRTTTPTTVIFGDMPECAELTEADRRADVVSRPGTFYQAAADRTDDPDNTLYWRKARLRLLDDGRYELTETCGAFEGRWSLVGDRLDLSQPIATSGECAKVAAPLDAVFADTADTKLQPFGFVTRSGPIRIIWITP